MMQLHPDLKKLRSYHAYRPCGHNWSVYQYTDYQKNDGGHFTIFTIGDKISEHLTKEEAKREVYRLNGWTYKEK